MATLAKAIEYAKNYAVRQRRTCVVYKRAEGVYDFDYVGESDNPDIPANVVYTVTPNGMVV